CRANGAPRTTNRARRTTHRAPRTANDARRTSNREPERRTSNAERRTARSSSPSRNVNPNPRRPTAVRGCHSLFTAAAERALHNRHDAHSACLEAIPVTLARWIVSAAFVAAAGGFPGAGARLAAQAQTTKPSIAGGWTLNKDLSDAPQDRRDQGDDRG